MAKPGEKPGLHHFAFELRNEIELINGYRNTKEFGKDFDFTMDHDVARCVYRLATQPSPSIASELLGQSLWSHCFIAPDD